MEGAARPDALLAEEISHRPSPPCSRCWPSIHAADALAEAHYLIGSSQAEQGQFAEAVQSLEASLAAQAQVAAGRRNACWPWPMPSSGSTSRRASPRNVRQADCRVSPTANFATGRITGWASVQPPAGDLKTAAAEYRTVAEKWPQSPLLAPCPLRPGLGPLGPERFCRRRAGFRARSVEKQPEAKLAPRPAMPGRWPGSSLASTPRPLKISRPCWRPSPRRRRSPTPAMCWGSARPA